jgi:hypothetical protein
MEQYKLSLLAMCAFLVGTTPAVADYTLVLKNGRQITVQSYREEGGMIKFSGLGGEIAISKDQIQTIETNGDQHRPSLNLTRPEPPPPTPAKEPTADQKTISSPISDTKVATPEESLAEQRAKEEKEYVKRVGEITQQIKEGRNRYAAETTGVTGPEPGFFTTDEAFQRHQADLMSRLIDAQNNPAGPGNTGEGASTPPDNRMPPNYTEREKYLSDLRFRINQLELERRKLIDEMKQKNFDVGSLFIE